MLLVGGSIGVLAKYRGRRSAIPTNEDECVA